MSIKYEKIVKEDLDLGISTVSITNPSGGSALTGTQLNAATWLQGVFNVKDYGAVGNGSNVDGHDTDGDDDTLAIQATIDACIAAGGGIVYFPPGIYRTTATLTIAGSIMPQLIGAGREVSVIRCNGINKDILSVVAGAVDTYNVGFCMKSLCLRGWHDAAHIDYNGRGLYMKFVHAGILDDVEISSNGKEGLYLEGCYSMTYRDVLVMFSGLSGNYDGIYEDYVAGTPDIKCDNSLFLNCASQYATRHGFNFYGGCVDIQIFGANIANNGYKHEDKGSEAGSGIVMAGVFGAKIWGNYLEHNPTYEIELNGLGGNLEVACNYMNGANNPTPVAIYVNQFLNTSIHHNWSSGHSTAFIEANPGTHMLDIGPNFVADTEYLKDNGMDTSNVWRRVIDDVGGHGNQSNILCDKMVGPLLIGTVSNTLTTSAALDIQSTTGALIVPRMDSTAAAALTPSVGMIIFNTTSGRFQAYDGAWTDLTT